VHVTYASRAAGSRPNDDFIVATTDTVIVLDGATAPVGVKSGCVHDVPWLVRHLAAGFVAALADAPASPLAEVLRRGIADTAARHADTCDLANPDSPSSTVSILRHAGPQIEYAVLADSPIVFSLVDGGLVTVLDERVSSRPERSLAAVRRRRNADGGFWVASTRPAAADHALTGCLPEADVRLAAVMTDGASRPVEHYGWSWGAFLDRLEADGPAAMIDTVRREDISAEPHDFAGKHPHDDITIAVCAFD
jgi:hypothetical protein